MEENSTSRVEREVLYNHAGQASSEMGSDDKASEFSSMRKSYMVVSISMSSGQGVSYENGMLIEEMFESESVITSSRAVSIRTWKGTRCYAFALGSKFWCRSSRTFEGCRFRELSSVIRGFGGLVCLRVVGYGCIVLMPSRDLAAAFLND